MSLKTFLIFKLFLKLFVSANLEKRILNTKNKRNKTISVTINVGIIIVANSVIESNETLSNDVVKVSILIKKVVKKIILTNTNPIIL
jgi:hypothetical protein